jgi:AcrR family transcriptional regulator
VRTRRSAAPRDKSATQPQQEPAERQRVVRRQARGLARIEAILDAAEAVIAEVGYPDANTNAIAARAGMSPGSLYQFFRNKDEIVAALARRYVDRLDEFWQVQLTPEVARQPLPDLVDRLLDAVVAFKSAQPAFWPLFYGSALPDRLAEVADALHQRTAVRVAALFAARAPDLEPGRHTLLATMTTATVRTTMPMVLAAAPAEAPVLLGEVKAMLVGYLGPALDVDASTAEPEPAGAAQKGRQRSRNRSN